MSRCDNHNGHMPPRIHVIGRKNSGKTTLIVELVEYLSSLGCRVGTIKHTHHHHELDTPGKDSHQHRQAGAVAVGILSPGMSAVFRPQLSQEPASARYEWLAKMFSDCDLVLIEGDCHTEAPKIEVWRAIAATEPMAARDPSILAVVTDDCPPQPLTVWPRSDVPSLADRFRALANACTNLRAAAQGDPMKRFLASVQSADPMSSP
jgi:molybdopterin-guanine dinucleotide biosynthesis protein MobB